MFEVVQAFSRKRERFKAGGLRHLIKKKLKHLGLLRIRSLRGQGRLSHIPKQREYLPLLALDSLHVYHPILL